MSGGVVKCVCPNNVINQEDDLKDTVRENEEIIFFLFPIPNLQGPPSLFAFGPVGINDVKDYFQ